MDEVTEETSVQLNWGCNNAKLFKRDMCFLSVVKASKYGHEKAFTWIYDVGKMDFLKYLW